MSFHFNLSSDEEDLEEWNRRERDDFSVAARSGRDSFLASPAVGGGTSLAALDSKVAPNPTSNGFMENDFDKKLESDSDSDSDEDDSIVWEDADGDAEESDGKVAAVVRDGGEGYIGDATKTSLRQVTVNLGEDPNDNEEAEPAQKKRKVRSRKKFRAESLPTDLQSLLKNLHRAHVLALTAQAFYISKLASSPELLAAGLSILPLEFHETTQKSDLDSVVIPSIADLKRLCQEWYFPLIHRARMRRQARCRDNRAAGAPVYHRRQRQRRGRDHRGKAVEQDTGDEIHGEYTVSGTCPAQSSRLSSYAFYLSNSMADDPRFGDEPPELQNNRWTAFEQNQLLLSTLRSLGWRARFVLALDPVKGDLDVNHPILSTSWNIFQVLTTNKSQKTTQPVGTPKLEEEEEEASKPKAERPTQLGWIEVLCRDVRQPNKLRWIHVDASKQHVNQPDQVEILFKEVLQNDSSNKRAVLAYAVAVEHSVRGAKFTDVTPRYAHSFVASLRHRGLLRGRHSKKQLSTDKLRKSWWGRTVQKMNEHFFRDSAKQAVVELQSKGATPKDAIAIDSSDDEVNKDRKLPAVKDSFTYAEEAEKEELHEYALNEAIPTSKSAFQTHPVYVIQSVLGNAEVLAPDAHKRVCGVFKGQMVYRRSDVSTAHPARKWPYLGRKVRSSELSKPIKQVKARKKPASKNFKALKSYGVGDTNDGSAERRLQDINDASQPLEDGMDWLYAIWQTDPWSPSPVGPADPIPVNEYKNVELELLNPGLVHIDYRGIAKVAKKLGIPYAPCMLGFEGQGGNRVPTVRGIVVHAHNEILLREAGAEVTSHALEQENSSRRRLVLKRWKKLLVGMLTKDRIEREYGDT